MINHEIRTPLNSILGFSSILQEEVESPEMKEHADFIYNSSMRLEKFLAVVLQLTELIARDRPLRMKSVMLGDILDECLLECFPLTTKKNISIKIDQEMQTLKAVVNESLIKNCLLGVLDNAIEFSPSKGDIRISVAREKGFAGYEITDQGPGFSEQALENLFRLFGLVNSISIRMWAWISALQNGNGCT